MTRSFDVIGTTVPKRDGAEKVTGRTRYLHDLVLPRLAHGKILRSPHPHARLVRIDTRRAAALPGVLAVLTAADVEQNRFGFARDQTALKAGKVRCIRDEIAAVAAETPAIAEEAVALIDVEYEELPAVFEPTEALRPGAPRVHDERADNHTDLRYQFNHGDVDRAFAEAAVVVEGTYRLNFVTTCCLETMVAIAEWDAQGQLTMWSTTQVPFLYQRDLARALGITGDRVRVLQPPVGGNFGRGLDLYPIDVIAALLARRVGRPVKVEFERLEEFVASPTREPCEIRLRTAADVSGRLLAREAHVTVDNGAYVSWGSTTPYVMLATVAGLYRVPNVRFDTTIAYTNNPYSGSMRGYGNLESTFAVESQMDELADRLGLDRLEIRRRNATKSGDVNPQGFVVTSCAMGECLEAVAEPIGPPVPPPGPGRGRRPPGGAGRGAGRGGGRDLGGGRAAAAAAVRARRARWPLPARRAHAGGGGLLRSADDDAGQGPARQRVGELRLRRPGRRAGRGGSHGRDPGAPRRLRPRRRSRPQPAGRRGADPRRHPHGARLRPGRASRRRERAGAHRVVHGLRHPASGRHARAGGASHRVARGRGPVRRQRPRRVRRDPGLGRRRQRRARRDRRALPPAADHGRPRARSACPAAGAVN